REWHEELDRRGEPQAVAEPRAIAAACEGQEGDAGREYRRLPEVVEDVGHHFFRVLSVSCCAFCFRIAFSRWRTSSSVSFPASTSCCIIGCGRPPKKLRMVSRSRCRATSRSTRGSKMCALPILRVRRTAP